jgi:glycine dehydrogenase subunit 2
MTMYFPLVVHGAMLIEPTETESKQELDRFIEALRLLAGAAKAGDAERFKGAPFGDGPCMHEAIFSDKGFADDVNTLDLAKALIDEGFHPMTMYFPLVVHGAMLIEPTETESKASLDEFIMAIRSIAERAKAGDQSLKAAPVYAPRRRLDETLAARKPVLTYKEPEPAKAAE